MSILVNMVITGIIDCINSYRKSTQFNVPSITNGLITVLPIMLATILLFLVFGYDILEPSWMDLYQISILSFVCLRDY